MSSPTKINHIMEIIEEVRERIKEEFESYPDLYDKVDIDRVENEEWSVYRFIKICKNVPDETFKLLKINLKWRRMSGVNLFTEKDFPIEFIKAGLIFSSGVDKNQRQVLYIRAKVYRNIPQLQELFKLFIIFSINKIDRIAGPNGYSLVFDLTGVSLSNANMEFLKFLINILSEKFIYGLRYVLVYNQPFILRPLWSIAKLWLGEGKKFIKFVKGNGIKEEIDLTQLPRYLGGISEIDLTISSEGCKPLKDLASKYGFSEIEVNTFLKVFQPHIEEAKRMVTRNY